MFHFLHKSIQAGQAWSGATLLAGLGLMACTSSVGSGQQPQQRSMTTEINAPAGAAERGPAKATFGTGCFWCTEAMFESLDGVFDAVSGYEGGRNANPTYEQVCTGTTGHAECVEVTYDPKKISYAELLQAFFRSHDPTSLNRQGADVGTQYRSVIFYHDSEQQQLAEQVKKELNASGAYDKPIVTEIAPASTFYVAEKYHQNYFAQNPDQGYCAYVVAPKLDKFRKVFKGKLKPELAHQ